MPTWVANVLAASPGKTKTAYVWAYRTTNFMTQRAVYYDFCKDRSGEHPRRVLHAFTGTLVSDDYTGSLSSHALHRRGVVAAFCMTHARRKLFEAHALNGSEIAAQAVTLLIARLDETEREARELDPDARHVVRQLRSKLIADALRAWLTSKRQTLATAGGTAKAIDYSLSNWAALTRFLDDGHVPIDNNAVENSVRPLALGRRIWLFVGSQQAGERSAVLLSLIESAKLNGHDLRAYVKDVFDRLPTLKQRDPAQLLPHHWRVPTPPAVVPIVELVAA